MTSLVKADCRPIGLFDSGIGGLTVLKSLAQALPSESFIYLGDTARLPYGSKSQQTIERYLRQNISFLLLHEVKAVVVACNSASTILLAQAPFEEHSIPIYNVIEPGALAAIEASQSRRIGVLGTKATIASNAYARSLSRLDASVEVFSQSCPLLVPLVEEGWEDDPLTNLIVYRYVQPLIEKQIDTLILGCTHYPVLKTAIQRVATSRVTLIESSDAIAKRIQGDFARGVLQRGETEQAKLQVLTTDISASFLDIARRLMHPFHVGELTHVDIGVGKGERD